jgi:hypothetical protein
MVEFAAFFSGAIFVIGLFSLTGAILSDRIYKICTPLSTGFVEKIRNLLARPVRKAWPGAGFRGVPHSPQCRGRDATSAAG